MKQKLWGFKYTYLVVINIFTCFSFYMITTILTTYLTGIGMDISHAGIVVGLFSITSLVIRPFTGVITDRFNKKKILIMGAVLVSISVIGYTLTVAYPAIVIFRLLHGVAFGFNSTAIVALASEYIAKDMIGQGIGYLGLGQIAASAVGPGLGVWIMNQYGVEYSFVVSAVFSLLCAVGMMFFTYRRPAEAAAKESIKLGDMVSVKILDYAFISGVYSFINGVISAFLVLYAAQKGIVDVSAYFLVCSVFLFLARPISGKIVDRKGLKYIVYPALGLSVAAMIILSRADTLIVLLLSGVVRALAQGAIQPSLQAACIKKVGMKRSGVATSTYYLGGDIGQGTGPIIGGFIAGIAGYEEVFYLCIILLIGSGILFYIREK